MKNIFDQDPKSPVATTPPAAQVLATQAPTQTPVPVLANVPAQPTPPPRPKGCGCSPITVAVGLVLIVLVIVVLNLVLGALGIPLFGRELFDKNVMQPFGGWVIAFVAGGSKTRLGYWTVLSVVGPLFVIVMTWIIARRTK